jgi:hypothetical protein
MVSTGMSLTMLSPDFWIQSLGQKFKNIFKIFGELVAICDYLKK